MIENLTWSERAVYDAIQEAAEGGLPCPINMDLEALINCSSTSQGAKVVAALEAKGLIIVRRFQRFRRVQIVETGKWTAKPDNQQTTRPHVPRGARNLPTDRKPYKMRLS